MPRGETGEPRAFSPSRTNVAVNTYLGALNSHVFETTDYDTMRFEVLDPNNTRVRPLTVTSMFPRNDANVSDLSNGADIFAQTRGAVSESAR